MTQILTDDNSAHRLLTFVQKKREKKRRRREKKTVMKDDVTFYYFFDSSFTTYLPHKRKQRRRILLLLLINNTCAWLRRALKLSEEGFPCPLPLSPALREEDFYHDEEDDEREEEATEVLPFACWGRCSMRSPGKGVPTRRKCRRRTFTSYRMGPTSMGTRSSTHL